MDSLEQTIEVKIIDHMQYKETHGLFVNGDLQYRGTQHECMFFQYKLIQMQKEKKQAYKVEGSIVC